MAGSPYSRSTALCNITGVMSHIQKFQGVRSRRHLEVRYFFCQPQLTQLSTFIQTLILLPRRKAHVPCLLFSVALCWIESSLATFVVGATNSPKASWGQHSLYSLLSANASLGCQKLFSNLTIEGVFSRGLYLFVNTAAAKSLQSCPTLCDPIDDSPPGSPVPGILQARTLEWVVISFSNA